LTRNQKAMRCATARSRAFFRDAGSSAGAPERYGQRTKAMFAARE
jgi:hypothetical protein